MQTKESLDLMNVDYEDVIQIYKAMRKSENAGKDKDRELAALKNRINQLQDSHNRFRGQIQALESVKELTVSLQTQVTSLQQENKQLLSENRELASLNLRAEELLREKEDDEKGQAKMLKNVQIEFATLTGRYEETIKAQRDLERMANAERSARMALDSRLVASDRSVSDLNEENKSLRHQLDSAQLKLNQCDQELLHASEQLSSITKEIVSISTTREALVNAEAEVSLLKGDISRLLRLVEGLGGGRDFSAHWADSEALTFTGMDYPEEEDDMYMSQSMFESGGQQSMSRKMSETEFAHLKRMHGKDPFPLTSSLAEEAEFWVPSEAARLGVQFMASKFPNTAPKVLMDFLRAMNKVWLRRERRKVKRVKEVLGADIEDLKRQISHSKPYKGVIQDRQIRRLQSQVKTDRRKSLTGRPRSRLEAASMDMDTTAGRAAGKTYFAVEDMDAADPGSRRLCKTEALRRSMEAKETEAVQVSTSKLLEASLHSLDTMNLRRSQMSHDPMARIAAESAEDTDASYPSASYLRGALWLGRNLSLLAEELAQAVDNLRMRTLGGIQEIESADSDGPAELKRAVHRLKILVTGAVTQACTLTSRCKNRSRSILQGVGELDAGNTAQFQRFLGTLPIESALLMQSQAHKDDAAEHSHGHTHGHAPASPNGRRDSRQSSPAVNRSALSMRMSHLLDTPMYYDT